MGIIFVLIIFLLCVCRGMDWICGCVIGLAKLFIFSVIGILVLALIVGVNSGHKVENKTAVARPVQIEPARIEVQPAQGEIEPPYVTKSRICRRRGGDYNQCMKS